MKAKLFILLFAVGCLLLYSSARYMEDSISIRQIETDLPIILGGNVEVDIVPRIHFPLVFEFRDDFSKERRWSNITYFYRNIRRGRGGWVSNIRVYQKDENELRCIYSIVLERTEELKRGRVQIVVYTSHEIDRSTETQLELKFYLEQLRQRGVIGADTLSVGTLREFRERHPELVKTLLGGDSIRFNMWGIGSDFYCPRRMALDTLITLPIKIF